MKAEVCEAFQGRASRRLPAARARTGTEGSPVTVRLLETTVRRLNERGLALLKKAVQAGDLMEGPAWKEIRPLWAGANESTLNRAACCPMVLLDFNFQRLAWWSRVINPQPPDESRQTSFIAFRTDGAITLARDLLLEAWSAARSLSPVSSLVFGMAPEVATQIARLSPCDLHHVVTHEIQELRPRWENRPMFWKELFLAATQMDGEILANVHLHCLQLLGGELASTRDKPQATAHAAKGAVIEASVE